MVRMDLLFQSKHVLPEGFVLIENFITIEQESNLMNLISNMALETFIFQGFEAKRKTKSYGHSYNFTNRGLSKADPIPDAFNFLIEMVADKLNLERDMIEQLLVTEYPPGSVINWHRDAPPFNTIIGVSLLSDCIFRLRPYDKSKRGRKNIVSMPVKRRSLYMMAGPARTEWEHSISPVKEKRFSITLRTLY
jgi:alkylated DNA repair dioxygenase AlkB